MTTPTQAELAKKHAVAALVTGGLTEKVASDKYDRYIEARSRAEGVLTPAQAQQVQSALTRIRSARKGA